MPKVTHFEILGKDGKKLRDFYGSLFGWAIDANNPMEYGIVPPTENGIGGGITASQDGSSMVTVYVEVDAIQPYLDKAVSLGGKIPHGAHGPAGHGHPCPVPGRRRQPHWPHRVGNASRLTDLEIRLFSLTGYRHRSWDRPALC